MDRYGTDEQGLRGVCLREDDAAAHDIQRLFADAMRGETELGHFDLQQRVMELSNVRSYQFLARLFRQAIEQDVIIKSRNQQGLVVYQAPPF